MTRCRLVAIVVACLLAAGCTTHSGPPAPTTSSPPSTTNTVPANPDAVIVQVNATGGFTAPYVLAQRPPEITVFADGRVVTPASLRLGTALATLRVRQVGASAVRSIVAAATRLRLTAGPLDFGRPGISDVDTTVVRIGDGHRIVATQSAYALGFDSASIAMLTTRQRAARRALESFVHLLTTLPGAERPYAPAAVAVFTMEPSSTTAGGAPRPWPIAAAPAPDSNGCVVVDGAAAASLVHALDGVGALSRWRVGGAVRLLAFRPIVSREGACAW